MSEAKLFPSDDNIAYFCTNCTVQIDDEETISEAGDIDFDHLGWNEEMQRWEDYNSYLCDQCYHNNYCGF